MGTRTNIVGLLLAGGQARRMGGGDKCLLPLGPQTLLQRSIIRAKSQVDELVLSANGNALRFARSRLPIVPDVYTDFPGPLAGIHAGMQWMRDHRPDCEWLASFACDTPFFPTDLVEKATAQLQREAASVAIACSDDQLHPTFGLWHLSLLDIIRDTLQTRPMPSLQQWVQDQEHCLVHFDQPGYDPFFNINKPQDLYDAEALLPLVEQGNP